jgi:short-chain 2-methylacyl-CoA dehydrogenase
MDFELSDYHRMLKNTVRKFAEKEIKPIAQQYDEAEEIPGELFKKMAEQGFLGAHFPVEYGGGGDDSVSTGIILEELERVDLTIAHAVFSHICNGGDYIDLMGSAEQKEKWLTKICKAEVIGGVAITEPDAGSDVSSLRTRAVFQDGMWVINGTKIFITGMGHPIGGLSNVVTRTGEDSRGRPEFTVFCVPTGTPGFRLGQKFKEICTHAMDNRELIFEDCRVPPEQVLGEPRKGHKPLMKLLTEARCFHAALSVGAIQHCLEACLAYAKERTQFGQPVWNFQVTQFKLADMLVDLEISRTMTYKSLNMRDQGKDLRRVSAVAKLFPSEAAARAARQAVQIFGGYGLMEDFDVSRYYRSILLETIGEGTSEIQSVILSRLLDREGVPSE